MQELQYLFVYGSLKRGISNPMGAMLRAHANYISEALIAGKLYNLGPYPGLVLEDSGTAVYGELYEIIRPNTLLTLLDAYEGCSLDDPQPHNFARVEAIVRDTEGRDFFAWVYVYQGSLESSELIASGLYQPTSGVA